MMAAADLEKYSDEELISFLRIDDPEDMITEYLLGKYKPLVRKKAHTLYLVGGENEDLIQEGMLGLFKALRSYDASKNAGFAAFASICVDRQMYHAIQQSNRKKNQPLNSSFSLSNEWTVAELLPNLEQTPEAILIDLENAAGIEKKIREMLSPYENKVLNYYLDGDDYLTIASKMGKTPKSIDNALQRIRQKARKKLRHKSIRNHGTVG